MTWGSLWWRVCLLARMHRRHARVAWKLWRRSRRPKRLPAPSYINAILNTEIGAPIRLNDYREIGNIALMRAYAAQNIALTSQQPHEYQMQQMQAMQQAPPGQFYGMSNALSGMLGGAGRT